MAQGVHSLRDGHSLTLSGARGHRRFRELAGSHRVCRSRCVSPLKGLDVYQLSERDARRLDALFTHHPPQGNQVERYELLREHARRMAHLIGTLTPCGPEQTTALRGLQETVMWANAAIAINEVWDGPCLREPITVDATPSK